MICIFHLFPPSPLPPPAAAPPPAPAPLPSSAGLLMNIHMVSSNDLLFYHGKGVSTPPSHVPIRPTSTTAITHTIYYLFFFQFILDFLLFPLVFCTLFLVYIYLINLITKTLTTTITNFIIQIILQFYFLLIYHFHIRACLEIIKGLTPLSKGWSSSRLRNTRVVMLTSSFFGPRLISFFFPLRRRARNQEHTRGCVSEIKQIIRYSDK